MNKSKEQLRTQIIHEIDISKMNFNRKMKLLKLLDTAFRKDLGVFYLSDKENRTDRYP